MFTIDFKSGYHHIDIFEEHIPYLRIIVLLFVHSVFRLRDTYLLKSAGRW